MRVWCTCLWLLAACGGAAPVATPPAEPDIVITPPVPREVAVPEPPAVPLDLIVPRADAIALFNVAAIYQAGLEPLGRAIFDELIGPEWDAVTTACGFNPAAEIDQVIISADATGNMVVMAVTFRDMRPQAAADCLARVVPDAHATELPGGRAGLDVDSVVFFPTDRALFMSDTEPLSRFLDTRGAAEVPAPALDRLETEAGTLVSVSAVANVLGFFRISSFHAHLRLAEGATPTAKLDLRFGGFAPLDPSVINQMDEEDLPMSPSRIHRDIASLLREVGPWLEGHPARARVEQAVRDVRIDQESSDELLLRFELSGPTKLDSLWQQAHQRYLIAETSRHLHNFVGSLQDVVNQRGLPGGACSTVMVPADVPRGPVRVGYEAWSGQPMSCGSFYGPSVLRQRFAYRRHGFVGPARGGPSPGAGGFELSAEWDHDGDGKTALITIAGKVVGGRIVTEPEFRHEVME